MKKLAVRTSLLAVVALLALGCKEETAPQKTVVRPIKMLTVGSESAAGKLEFPGRIRAADEARLSFEVDGKVEKIHVSEGERVKKGAALAEIDNRDYAARFDEVSAEKKEAQARYDRAKELFANDSISQQDLDVDRRSYEVAVARLKTAQKAVEDTILRAPFDGIVAKRYVDNFEQVRAKQDVIFFHAETGLEVQIDVPERLVRAYGSGPAAKPDDAEEHATSRFSPLVEVEGLKEPLKAEFSEIATAADPVTRTFEIKLGFAAPEGATILPGMTAKVVLDVGSATKDIPLRVPALAVVAQPDKSAAVFLVDKKTMTVKRHTVKVGKMAENEINVLEGLKPGDTIALSGLESLQDGMEVTKYDRMAKK